MGRVVLDQILELLQGPDILKIMDKETGEVLFKGYKGILVQDTDDFITLYGVKPIKKYHVHCEIRNKEWARRGLVAPMLPEALPQYSFKDMQVNLIHEIEI